MHAAAVAHVAAAQMQVAHGVHGTLSQHHASHLHGPPTKRKRRHRTIFTEEQLEQLGNSWARMSESQCHKF